MPPPPIARRSLERRRVDNCGASAERRVGVALARVVFRIEAGVDWGKTRTVMTPEQFQRLLRRRERVTLEFKAAD